MKISYYPGCTLKTKAKNLEEAAVASMAALGVDFEELPRWNCCGAVHSLADDDLIQQVAPIRDLVRAMDQGSDKVVTLWSMCYNTLARANHLMRDDDPDLAWMADKVVSLRILEDGAGKMNRSALEVGGQLLARLAVHPVR